MMMMIMTMMMMIMTVIMMIWIMIKMIPMTKLTTNEFSEEIEYQTEYSMNNLNHYLQIIVFNSEK